MGDISFLFFPFMLKTNLFPPVLCLGRFFGLPLHIRKMIGPPSSCGLSDKDHCSGLASIPLGWQGWQGFGCPCSQVRLFWLDWSADGPNQGFMELLSFCFCFALGIRVTEKFFLSSPLRIS